VGWRYDAIATQKPGAGLDAVVRFCRVDVPLIAFCAAQFTVLAVALCSVAPTMRAAYDRMDVPLPGMTIEVLWLADHFRLVVMGWIALVCGICRLGRIHAPTALAVALVLHGFVIGRTVFALLLPMVAFR